MRPAWHSFLFVISIAFVLVSAIGEARSNDISARLYSLQQTPAVAEALGPHGRILEAVNFDAGIMVRYKQTDRVCLGKLVVMPSGQNQFEADPRCPVTHTFSAATQALPMAPMAYEDIAEFGRAVTFVQRMQSKRSGRGIKEVLAARRDETRLVLTYRTRDTGEICQVSLVPSNVYSPSYAWRIDPNPACDVQ